MNILFLDDRPPVADAQTRALLLKLYEKHLTAPNRKARRART